MPYYEYHCASCGHHHEELQKVADKPLRKCPACGRNKLSRLISAPVFRLKGGGWYETDFKSDKEGKRNLAGEKEQAEPKTEAVEKPKEASEKKEPAAQPAEKAAPIAKQAARPRQMPRKKAATVGKRPAGRRSK